MTPDEINTAIAESLGWTILSEPVITRHCACYAKDPNGHLRVASPDYTKSLDSCVEFESNLPEDYWWRYAWFLVQVSDPDEQFKLWKNPEDLQIWEMTLSDCFTCASAKPIHRCEAYLRTICEWAE